MKKKKALKVKKHLKRIIRLCKKNKDTGNEVYYKWLLHTDDTTKSN